MKPTPAAWLSVSDAACRAGVSRARMFQVIHASPPMLKSDRAWGGKLRVSRASLEAWMADPAAHKQGRRPGRETKPRKPRRKETRPRDPYKKRQPLTIAKKSASDEK